MFAGVYACIVFPGDVAVTRSLFVTKGYSHVGDMRAPLYINNKKQLCTLNSQNKTRKPSIINAYVKTREAQEPLRSA